MAIDRRLKKAAIIGIDCILCSAFYMVVYNLLSERILNVTKPPFLLFLNGWCCFSSFGEQISYIIATSGVKGRDLKVVRVLKVIKDLKVPSEN